MIWDEHKIKFIKSLLAQNDAIKLSKSNTIYLLIYCYIIGHFSFSYTEYCHKRLLLSLKAVSSRETHPNTKHIFTNHQNENVTKR